MPFSVALIAAAVLPFVQPLHCRANCVEKRVRANLENVTRLATSSELRAVELFSAVANVITIIDDSRRENERELIYHAPSPLMHNCTHSASATCVCVSFSGVRRIFFPSH